MSKRNFGTIKSLLHFDYPYFNEPNDGLDDEVGLETWTKSGTNVKLYGSVIPKAGTLAPKFGYRCLYTNKAYIYCNNESGIWNLNSSGTYEIEMFVQINQTANEQNIFSLMNTDNTYAIFTLSTIAGGYLNLAAPSSATYPNFGVGGPSTLTMSANTWNHILIRISNEHIYVFLNGVAEIGFSLQPNIELSVGQVRIGNDISSYVVYVDEFVFRHSAGTSIHFPDDLPTEPYKAALNPKNIGGYGRGSDGNVTITANMQINSYAAISSVTDSHSFTISAISTGSIPFAAGREIMIHVTGRKSTDTLLGFYAFAKIKSIDGNSVVLRRNITTEKGDDFTLDSSLASTYYVQMISVPNYNTLTINASRTVTPLSWGSGRGGIVVFRCRGDCTINGSIISHGRGAARGDRLQMTHSKLIDRFLFAGGGGIFITCGGTFTAPSTARFGATWSGLGDGSNGAAGYGAKGGDAFPSGNTNYKRTGGSGGVGGGGGGAVSGSNQAIISGSLAKGGAVGSTGLTGSVGSGGGGCGGKGGTGSSGNPGGSGGGGQGGSGGAGGINGSSNTAYHGISANGVNGGSSRVGSGNSYCGGAGGGGPGGNGGTGYKYNKNDYKITASGGVSGASIILVCNKLATDQESLSTGGGTALYQGLDSGYSCIGAGGGGGTGFCYIAAGELLNE